MDWRERIALDYHLRPGQPVVKGSRVEVAFILGKLAEGLSPDDIVTAYPQLSVEDVRACLHFASALVHAQKFPDLLRPGDIQAAIKEKRDQILQLAAKHGATDVRVIRSSISAAGDDGELELLVGLGPKRSPWFPGGLISDLEDLLGCRVVVITEGGLKSPQKEQSLKEAVRL